MKKVCKSFISMALCSVVCLSCAFSTGAAITDEAIETSETIETAELGFAEETSDTAESTEPFIIENELNIELKYDDFFDITSLYDDYVIAKIEDKEVTSYQVEAGKKTPLKDTCVAEKSNKTQLHASGCGSSLVYLVHSSDEKSYVNGNVVHAVLLNVTVNKSDLTVVYGLGQSNMEGYCSVVMDYRPEDSVLCPKGQVYTSYTPGTDYIAVAGTGISDNIGINRISWEHFMPSSLGQSPKNKLNENMLYKLDALTENGKGKTGIDSAFSYEYNKLSGTKVWFINISKGGSFVSEWVQNGPYYDRAKNIMPYVNQLVEAESDAGHYNLDKTVCLWLQGESDKKTSFDSYYNNFSKVLDIYKSFVNYDIFGIIAVRSSEESGDAYRSYKDLSQSAARLVQNYYALNPNRKDVIYISTANESWISDSSVKAYFEKAYPNGYLDYPLRSDATISKIPTTMREAHDDIHYGQACHNENGLTAARVLYNYTNGYDTDSPVSVHWINRQGATIPVGSTVHVKSGSSLVAAVRFEPVTSFKNSKLIYDDSYVSYNEKTQTFTPKKDGTSKISVTDLNSNTIGSFYIESNKFDYETPQFTLKNQENGVKISWEKIAGVSKYRVFYYGKDGWKRLTDTTSTSFIDSDVRSGNSYKYTVRCISSDGKSFISDYHPGKTIQFIAPPDVSLSNHEDGVKISWNKLTGAVNYRIFYYYKDEWHKLATTTSTSYIDKDVRSGNTYTYTVRCVSADGSTYVSDYLAGKKIKYIAAPDFSLSNHEDGVKVSWNKVTGAAKYRVFYYGSDGWRRLTDTTSTSFIDEDVRSGNSYKYTVRCVSADGKEFTSDYRSGKTIKYIAPPDFSLSNHENGVKISWNKVTGAVNYRIFYYYNNEWHKLATTTSTSYVDKDVRSGNTYTYTVRCVSADGSTYVSDYLAGKKIKYIAAPNFSLSNHKDGVKISWNKVIGAAKYRVFYYGKDGWRRLADTTSTSFIDEDVRSGNSYKYTVRCVSADGKEFTSDYRAGKTIKYIAP